MLLLFPFVFQIALVWMINYMVVLPQTSDLSPVILNIIRILPSLFPYGISERWQVFGYLTGYTDLVNL